MPLETYQNRRHADVGVIGLGATGAAVAYQLAKNGVDVIGFDSDDPPHEKGGSGGDTRITRLAMAEGDIYVDLTAESNQTWRELEAAELEVFGRKTELMRQIGYTVIQQTPAAADVHGKDFYQDPIDVAHRRGLPIEELNTLALARRYPQFRVRPAARGYSDPNGGILFPDNCIRAQLTHAECMGAVIRRNEAVGSFNPTPDGGFSVTTNKDGYHFNKLVLCNGPWMNESLPQEIEKKLDIHLCRQVMFWLQMENPEHYGEGFPAFSNLGEKFTYGTPWIRLNGPFAGLKIAHEQHIDVSKNPYEVHKKEVTPEEIATILKDANEIFSTRAISCLHSHVCMYMETRDFGFIVDRHPYYPNMIIASACSGHGFKNSAGLGRVIADLVIHGKSRYDLSPFKMDRFTTACAPS